MAYRFTGNQWIGADISGQEQIAKHLRTVGKKAGRKGLIKATAIVAADAKKRAPRRTGRLRSSLRRTGSKGEIRGTAPYAAWVHYGTRRAATGGSIYHAEKAGGSKGAARKAREQGGKPFIYDAINANLHEIMTAIAQEVAKTINDDAAKRR